MRLAAAACERYGWTLRDALDAPLGALLMMLRQPSAESMRGGLTTGDIELMEKL